jgi:hypothetical protein
MEYIYVRDGQVRYQRLGRALTRNLVTGYTKEIEE